MLTPAQYTSFRQLVEGQSLRHLRRYLDYGKRARQDAGWTELHQWIGRILLDQESVYELEDKASAFEVAACEWLARNWDALNHPEAEVVTIAGPVDKVLLVRLIIATSAPAQRTGLAMLFAERYGRTWTWVQERAGQVAAATATDEAEEGAPVGHTEESGQGDRGAALMLFERFVQQLDALDPLPGGAGPAAEQSLREAKEREERLRREVAATTDRAERAATRVEAVQEELAQLRRTTRQEQDNGDKLRDERSRRIKLERQARDLAQELERIKSEYLKLDARMRDVAQRDSTGSPVGSLEELGRLAQVEPGRLLGLSPGASDEDLAKARRRFAAAFHSDRAAQLPDWVREVFDQLLGAVNAACDRMRR